MIQDGGSAFPQPFNAVAAGDNVELTVPDPVGLMGMSLRDYFACQAMNALLNKAEYDEATGDFWFGCEEGKSKQISLIMNNGSSEIASAAYDVADSMLIARKREE